MPYVGLPPGSIPPQFADPTEPNGCAEAAIASLLLYRPFAAKNPYLQKPQTLQSVYNAHRPDLDAGSFGFGSSPPFVESALRSYGISTDRFDGSKPGYLDKLKQTLGWKQPTMFIPRGDCQYCAIATAVH